MPGQIYAPRVSVVIPTYNREACLLNLLESLNQQDYPNYEIIVFDQSEEVSEMKREYFSRNHKQVVYRHSATKGRSIAKNESIQYCSGDLILFCDDDITVPNNFVSMHVRYHSDPRLGAISFRMVEDDLPPTQSSDIMRLTWYGRVLAGFHSDVECEVEWFTGNFSVKKDVFLRTSGFDTTLIGTSIFEEFGVSDEIRHLGYRILFSNAISARHFPQADGNIGSRNRNPAEYYFQFHYNMAVALLRCHWRLRIIPVVCFAFLRSVKQTYSRGLRLRDGAHMMMGVIEGWKAFNQTKVEGQ